MISKDQWFTDRETRGLTVTADLHHKGGNYDTCFTWSCGRDHGPLPVWATQASGTGWNPPKTSFQVGLEWWHRTWRRHPCFMQGNWAGAKGRWGVGWPLSCLFPPLHKARPLGRGQVQLSNLTWAEASPVSRGVSAADILPGILTVSSLKSCYLLFLHLVDWSFPMSWMVYEVLWRWGSQVRHWGEDHTAWTKGPPLAAVPGPSQRAGLGPCRPVSALVMYPSLLRLL